MARNFIFVFMYSISLAFATFQENVGDLFGRPSARTRATFKQGYSFTHYDGKAYIFGGSEGTGDALFALAISFPFSP